MFRPRVAVMATGGIDSTVLLHNLVKMQGVKPTVITVNYGHTAFQRQVENLNFHIKELGLDPLVVIDINFAPWQKQPGLFTPSFTPTEEDPLNDWGKLRYENFFIEGRNMIMVAYALSYCSAHKIDELQTGYLYGEEEWQNRRSYKLMTGDNSPQFVDMMNLLTNVGLSNQVRLRAPYYEGKHSKEDVINLGFTLNVDFEKTYSCYFDEPCGKCDNCLLRAKYLGE